jgi:hypothetical protein
MKLMKRLLTSTGEMKMKFKVGDLIRQKGTNKPTYKVTKVDDTYVLEMVSTLEEGYVYTSGYKHSLFELVKPAMTQKEAIYAKIVFLEAKRKLKLATLLNQADAQSATPTEVIDTVTTWLNTLTDTATATLADIISLETLRPDLRTLLQRHIDRHQAGSTREQEQLGQWIAEA